MCEATYETKDHHTPEDIKANLRRTIEHLMIVLGKVNLIKDTEQLELCFEATNEMVAISASLYEGLLQALGAQGADPPAPTTIRATDMNDSPQSVARPRG